MNENGLPRVFDPRNDMLFDRISGCFAAECIDICVIARPQAVAIRSF